MAGSADFIKDEKDVDKSDKCPICFNEPRTSRLQCIKDHDKNSLPGDEVSRPACRSHLGIDQLDDNFFAAGLANAVY